MSRDYTDFMHMTAQELAQYARDEAEGDDLINALADMISAILEENDELSTAAVDLKNEAEELARARDEWQSMAESLNAMVKGLR